MILSTGEAVAMGCAWGRNIILAHMITKADFGVAATLALVVLIFDLARMMSVTVLIVQSKNGAKRTFQATAHMVQAAIGLAGALLILLLSGRLAIFFEMPELRQTFLILACVPALQGLVHLDIFRKIRHMNYLPGRSCGSHSSSDKSPPDMAVGILVARLPGHAMDACREDGYGGCSLAHTGNP